MGNDTVKAKFIFVTGGVVSSLGKAGAAAAAGSLLECYGLKVTFLKFDPYINVDPGTMNPFQHGEVFVTDDGTETDLDLGHYERYTTVITSAKNNFTTGKIYYNVITKERRGEYLGCTVQMVPHITDEIKTKPTQHSVNKMREIGIQPDILVCRSDRPISEDVKKKIALFCNVEAEAVIIARHVG